MNKKSIIAVCLAVALLAGFLAFYWAEYEAQTQNENIKKFLDFQTQILNKNIEEEKLSAMTVAVLLSQNEHIKKCFLDADHKRCMATLAGFVDTLRKVPIYKNVKFHLHTPQMKSFARSWMPLHDDDLGGFRHMLSNAKNGIVAGIEVGRAGVFIRAVAPIFDGEKQLGSIEVLLDFEHLSDFFSQQGLSLFVMLEKSESSPFQDKSGENIIDGFTFVNKNHANLNILPILKDIPFESGKFYKFKSHNFTIQPMNDTQGARIGYFVIYFNADFKERNLSKINVWSE